MFTLPFEAFHQHILLTTLLLAWFVKADSLKETQHCTLNCNHGQKQATMGKIKEGSTLLSRGGLAEKAEGLGWAVGTGARNRVRNPVLLLFQLKLFVPEISLTLSLLSSRRVWTLKEWDFSTGTGRSDKRTLPAQSSCFLLFSHNCCFQN